MSELTEFLLAQIAADEELAFAATPGPWTTSRSKYVSGHYVHVDEANGRGVRHATQTSAADAAHIARHNPARVLAQCAAFRAIVAVHSGQNSWECPACVGETDFDESSDGERHYYTAQAVTPCPTLRALASIYADREGYREEWR